jgi:hypothetical protein
VLLLSNFWFVNLREKCQLLSYLARNVYPQKEQMGIFGNKAQGVFYQAWLRAGVFKRA